VWVEEGMSESVEAPRLSRTMPHDLSLAEIAATIRAACGTDIAAWAHPRGFMVATVRVALIFPEAATPALLAAVGLERLVVVRRIAPTVVETVERAGL
jgi:predicted methyltransferase MtxX (methanogen marker protein 4)